MKLELRADIFKDWIGATNHYGELTGRIDSVIYDTRLVGDPTNSVFFALPGEIRDGHSFLNDAYSAGIRFFVVSKPIAVNLYPEALIFQVGDVLDSLQLLATNYRKQFKYPVISIVGSSGKTTVKEWLYHLLSPSMRISRSPKSYNSQIGVALSLLSLKKERDLAIIEAAISEPGEAAKLHAMIQPTHALITSISGKKLRGFSSKEELLTETFLLCQGCETITLPDSLSSELADNYKEKCRFVPSSGLNPAELNARLAFEMAAIFSSDEEILQVQRHSLPKLALRMETFEGVNNNTIINDSYNLDFDALQHSLEYQLSISKGRKRVVIVGLDSSTQQLKGELEEAILKFSPDDLLFVEEGHSYIHNDYENSVILIKGTRRANMQRIAAALRLKKHQTYVSVDLGALRSNVLAFQQAVGSGTKLIAMVKASSYGSGIDKVANHLEACGINHFGVAYADEGVEMRKLGIQSAIMVMNAEEDGFEDCIRFGLQVAIYSIEQLERFISECIFQNVSSFPIHLKIETGMKRLGFELDELGKVCEMINAQPEVKVISVYSHLADADNKENDLFTRQQFAQFDQAIEFLKKDLPYSFDTHIQNSEGMANFKGLPYSMARLGIGMYGISVNPKMQQQLKPVLGWNSSVSQIKKIEKGESIGYGRSFIASAAMKIAIVPVGYADGFRRSLSNGKGGVYIKDIYCPTVARVCMDMIMVDVSHLDVIVGDVVEIIGRNQSIEDLALAMETIPYEVMTGISKRVARVYLG